MPYRSPSFPGYALYRICRSLVSVYRPMCFHSTTFVVGCFVYCLAAYFVCKLTPIIFPLPFHPETTDNTQAIPLETVQYHK